MPPAVLWVFSIATTEVRGVWKMLSETIEALICSGDSRPSRPG